MKKSNGNTPIKPLENGKIVFCHFFKKFFDIELHPLKCSRMHKTDKIGVGVPETNKKPVEVPCGSKKAYKK